MVHIEQSKVVFQKYCVLRAFTCTPIAESTTPDVRTPDLDVTAKGFRFIVECKDLTANETDIENWRKTKAGQVVVRSREPGKRARSSISTARGQLRPYVESGLPGVVALYDNLIVDGVRPYPNHPLLTTVLSPTDIDIALYGLWQANVRIHPNLTTESLGDTRNRRRRIEDREIISAVCVLHDDKGDDDPYIIAYHNYWARVPLPTKIFDCKNDRHFVKQSDPDKRPNPWEQA